MRLRFEYPKHQSLIVIHTLLKTNIFAHKRKQVDCMDIKLNFCDKGLVSVNKWNMLPVKYTYQEQNHDFNI
ncbi:hypothetical protein C9J38_10895 [Photobacterium sp. GB-210]|nr:hypothetical protein C9J38_10895 [Photobacterium sp. GB-210]